MSVDVAAQPTSDTRKLSRQLTRAGWVCFLTLVVAVGGGQLNASLRTSASGWARVVAQDVIFLLVASIGYSLLGLRRYLTNQGYRKPGLLLGIVSLASLISGLAPIVLFFLLGLLGSFPSAPSSNQDAGMAPSVLSLLFILSFVTIGVLVIIGPVRMFGLKYALGLSFVFAAVLHAVPYVGSVLFAVLFVVLGIVLLRAADEVNPPSEPTEPMEPLDP
jgi:hypothetical protein